MAEEKKKSQVDDINRSIYDIKDKVEYSYKADNGLTEEVIREISAKKEEPEWMLEKRLQALEIYNHMDFPEWAPDISELDMDHIDTYIRPKTDMKAKWEDLPQNIRDTFDRLGIPEAEKKSLAGVGAQYDSEVVYHNIQKELEEQGVIYVDFETAVKEYPDLIKPYFGKLITPNYHKFAALHYAVWSGGSFVYVPKGVHVRMPLQSYFRLNAPGAGQFEHTLIIIEEGADCHFIEGCSAPRYNVANLHAGAVELYVKKGATLRYSTIENWSKNMYNLNTKRALVEEGGTIRIPSSRAIIPPVISQASRLPARVSSSILVPRWKHLEKALPSISTPNPFPKQAALQFTAASFTSDRKQREQRALSAVNP